MAKKQHRQTSIKDQFNTAQNLEQIDRELDVCFTDTPAFDHNSIKFFVVIKSCVYVLKFDNKIHQIINGICVELQDIGQWIVNPIDFKTDGFNIYVADWNHVIKYDLVNDVVSMVY